MASHKSVARKLLQHVRINMKRLLLGSHPSLNPHTKDWEDTRRLISTGKWVIIIGFGGFLVWASLAPLDEGVVAHGLVSVESKRKVISHLTGGVVSKIHVKENQHVKSGDILIELDSIQALATLDMVHQQHASVTAKLARLKAEQTQADTLSFPDEIKACLTQSWCREARETQEHLFRTRRQALASEQAILKENLAAIEKQVAGTRQQLQARNQQYKLLQQEIEGLRPLVSEGYATRNQLLSQERAQAELSSINSELETNLAKGSNQAGEIRLRLLKAKQDFLQDVEAQLADAQRDAANLGERLKSAREDYARTTIRSPVTGQVVALLAQTPGGIISPGGKILEVVPEGDQLLVDVQVPPDMISRISQGQASDVRINAFPETPQLVLAGKVLSVSSDRHSDPATGISYYLARIEITAEGQRELSGRALQPGMPVDAVIKTGERTFMMYLIRPLLQRLFPALHEY